jgi:hypothetical protein
MLASPAPLVGPCQAAACLAWQDISVENQSLKDRLAFYVRFSKNKNSESPLKLEFQINCN